MFSLNKHFVFLFQIFSELPFHTFFVAVYCVPVYFLAGFKLDVNDFFIVFGILFLLVYCSRTLAMFAAAWMPTFQLSCFFAQTFFSMYIMSAGFFINLDNIFSGMFPNYGCDIKKLIETSRECHNHKPHHDTKRKRKWTEMVRWSQC